MKIESDSLIIAETANCESGEISKFPMRRGKVARRFLAAFLLSGLCEYRNCSALIPVNESQYMFPSSVLIKRLYANTQSVEASTAQTSLVTQAKVNMQLWSRIGLSWYY